MSTFQDVEKSAFLPAAVTAQALEIVEGAEGASAVIDGVEYPILSEVFDTQIVQPGHVTGEPKFKGHVGEIYIDGIEEFSDERTLLPISIVRFSQSMFQGNFDQKRSAEENKPVCFSPDGIKPSERVEKAMCGSCGTLEEGKYGLYFKPICPKAAFGPNGEKPECRRSVVLAFLDITDTDSPFPVRMSLHGSGYSAFTNLQKSFNRIRNVARLKKQSINDYAIKMTVDNMGTYCVPVFTPEYDADKPSKFTYMRAYYRDNILNRERSVVSNEAEAFAGGGGEALGSIDVSAAVNSSENADDFEF